MNIREGTRVNQSVSLHAKRIVFLLLCLLLALGAAAPCSAFAQGTGRKHVRVGMKKRPGRAPRPP